MKKEACGVLRDGETRRFSGNPCVRVTPLFRPKVKGEGAA
jgi:hypothetical protein